VNVDSEMIPVVRGVLSTAWLPMCPGCWNMHPASDARPPDATVSVILTRSGCHRVFMPPGFWRRRFDGIRLRTRRG
jgi:hypothetical protein